MRKFTKIITRLACIMMLIISGVVLTKCTNNDPVIETQEFTTVTTKPVDTVDTKDSINKPDAQNKRDSSDTKKEANKEKRRGDSRYTEESEEIPTFETMSDGTIWYNNEKDNYSFKFPGWMQKKIVKSGKIKLSGNALNATLLKSNDTFVTDSVTFDVNYLPLPEGADFDIWFAGLTKSFDDLLTYNGWSYKVDAPLDSGGPFMRRSYTSISDNGAIEVTFTYYSAPDVHDPAFQKKVEEAFGMINFSATELFLSN